MKRRTGLKKAQQGCPGKSPGTAASGGQAGWMPVSAHAVFLRGTPPGVASIMMAGLLTRGSWPSPPSRCSAPVAYRGWLPLTVAGAVADSAPDGYSSPHSLFTRSEPRPTREPSPPEMPPNAAEVNCRLRGAKAFWRSSVLRAALHVPWRPQVARIRCGFHCAGRGCQRDGRSRDARSRNRRSPGPARQSYPLRGRARRLRRGR